MRFCQCVGATALVFVGLVRAEWTPAQQVALENPTAVAVSHAGAFAAYTVSTVTGDVGNLTSTGSMTLVDIRASKEFSLKMCLDGGCSQPAFTSDGTALAFLHAGSLFRMQLPPNASKSPEKVPTGPAEANGGVLAYAVSPEAPFKVAFTYAEMGTFSATEPRVVTNDVIVNVITGTPQPLRNILCVGAFNDATEASSPHCYSDKSYASVGMEGWRISCWPFDSQFSWAGQHSNALTVTLTDDRTANGWETVRLATVDTSNAAAKFEPVPNADLSFQPLFSPDGAWLAFTQADTAAAYAAGDPGSYTWAQTWNICIAPATTRTNGTLTMGTAKCNRHGTADSMPVLVGWSGSNNTEVLYMEQQGTVVSLYSMIVDATGQPGGWHKVAGTPCSKDSSDCGVLGGGFRATARVGVSPDGGHVAFSWENLHTPPQAYVGQLSPTSNRTSFVSNVVQLSHLNKDATHQTWPNVTTRTWKSTDGTPVSGLLIHAVTKSGDGDYTTESTSPPPLLVFTHCGPAMASLSTFLGAGSVCARFPLATWAMRGYNVLLPNYRGSTGYGRDFRRGDLDGWGSETGDYADVMTGFLDMANSGLAALDNTAHVGWSYGGYTGALALTKAFTTHGITLKAVVAGGLLSDLISQTGTTDITKIYQSSNSQRYYWQSPTVQSNFMKRSAMYHIANATAPTIMFHGQQDPRMPISQAFQLHYALEAQNVTNRFLVFPGSGHIPGNQNQIVRVWQESLDWIAEHVPV